MLSPPFEALVGFAKLRKSDIFDSFAELSSLIGTSTLEIRLAVNCRKVQEKSVLTKDALKRLSLKS